MNPVADFPALFGPGIDTLAGGEAEVTEKPDVKSRFYRPRPIPSALQEKVGMKLDRMTNECIIRQVKQSKWAAPIVVVRKRDNEIRICGGYQITINLQDLFAALPGGTRFSKLNMKQAYMQMKVKTDSQEYLTINTRKGPFTFTTMQFGISTAPSMWQQQIDRILSGVKGALCYMNDVLVVGRTQAEQQ